MDAYAPYLVEDAEEAAAISALDEESLVDTDSESGETGSDEGALEDFITGESDQSDLSAEYVLSSEEESQADRDYEDLLGAMHSRSMGALRTRSSAVDFASLSRV